MGLISDNNYFKSMPSEVADVLERFDPKKPILEYTPPPSFKKESEKHKYYDIQRERWLNGYNGIPGTLYFKTMECNLADRISGMVERPVCRDADLYNHVKMDLSRKNKNSYGVIKPRGIGFSTDGACVGIHAMCTGAGGSILLTAKDLSTISTIFNDKFLVIYDNLDPYIKPEQKSINKTKNHSNLIVETEYINKEGELKRGKFKIDARETANSDDAASGFSGTGAKFGLFDELPLHKRREKLLGSTLDLFRNHRTGQLDGFLMWGGTVEDTLKNDEIVAFRKTIESSKTWRSDIVFFEYGWGMQDPTKTDTYLAWTDWAYARKWYEGELEDKANSPQALRAFKKNKPASLADVFDLLSGDFWEEDVTEITKNHYTWLQAQPPKTTKGTLVRNLDDVTFRPSKTGKVEILEMPKTIETGFGFDVKYFMGIDGASSDRETSVQNDSDRSKVAATVMKMYESPEAYNFCPVAIYCELPIVMQRCYEALACLAVMYKARTRAENNAGQGMAINTYFTNEGLKGLLMPEQLIAGTNHLKGKNSIVGKYRTDTEIENQKEFGNIYLRKYVQSILIEPLMSEIAFANNTDNFDILDSFLTCLSLCFGYIFKKQDTSADVRKFVEEIRCVPDGKGGMTWQVRKNNVGSPSQQTNEKTHADGYTAPYLR